MRKSLILGALALGLFACEQESETIAPAIVPVEIAATDRVPAHAEAVYNKLIEAGHAAADITFNEDLQIALVNDVAYDYDHNFADVSESPYSETSGKPLDLIEKARWGNRRIRWDQARNIKYFIETNTSGRQTQPSREYRDAFVRAAAHWSWASANINMTRTFNRSEADIRFFNYYWPQRPERAIAKSPTGESPYNVGLWVLVNTSKEGDVPYNNKVALMAHEIGHSLGFKHSNQTEGTQIPNSGSTNFHINNQCGSVMRSIVYTCSCFNNNGGMIWNTNDQAMVEYAYRYR